jgi:hypothetical protein
MKTCFSAIVTVILLLFSNRILAQTEPETTPEATPEFEDFMAGLVDASFSIDNVEPLAGIPLEITLTISTPPEITVAEFPQFSTDWSPFMLTQVSEMTSRSREDGGVIYHQTLTGSLWTPGDYTTPDTFVGYQYSGGDEIFRVPVSGLSVTVPSILDLNDRNLRPAKPQIGLFYVPFWAASSVLLSACGVVFVARRRLQNRRVRSHSSKSGETLPPIEALRLELLSLRETNKPSNEIFASVSNELRNYVFQSLRIPTSELTTAELIHELERGDYFTSLEYVQELQQLLEQTDLAKFANIQPDNRAIKRLLNRAYRWASQASMNLSSNLLDGVGTPQ